MSLDYWIKIIKVFFGFLATVPLQFMFERSLPLIYLCLRNSYSKSKNARIMKFLQSFTLLSTFRFPDPFCLKKGVCVCACACVFLQVFLSILQTHRSAGVWIRCTGRHHRQTEVLPSRQLEAHGERKASSATLSPVLLFPARI